MKLPLDEILIDPSIQIRDKLDMDVVERYMESLDSLPPVVVFNDALILADIHPVTEWGYHHHDEVDQRDGKSVKAAVPWGSGNKTYGWVLAKDRYDPCWVAYTNHIHNVVLGAKTRVEDMTRVGSDRDVIDGPMIYPVIPLRAIEAPDDGAA